jgi:hypothetical protein
MAVLSRLVRVMRQKDERGVPWLGPFIEWLLYRDATDTSLNYQSSVYVCKALTLMAAPDGLLSGSAFIKAARRECPGITFVSTLSPAVPMNGKGEWSEGLPVNEEDQFYQILRMWRLEYPEPMASRHPKGHLGREESGD